MIKAQFIAGCVMCGYCTKKTAEKYAAGKDDLTDADFEEVYRIEQDKLSREEARQRDWRNFQGARTKKRLAPRVDGAEGGV